MAFVWWCNIVKKQHTPVQISALFFFDLIMHIGQKISVISVSDGSLWQ